MESKSCGEQFQENLILGVEQRTETAEHCQTLCQETGLLSFQLRKKTRNFIFKIVATALTGSLTMP